jgi:hypothetical protein
MNNLHYHDTKFLKIRDWIMNSEFRTQKNKGNRTINITKLFRNSNAIRIIENALCRKNENIYYYLLENKYERRLNIYDIGALCNNINAINILEKLIEIDTLNNTYYIDWCDIALNINAMPLIEKYINNIDINKYSISSNINCIDFITKNPSYIDWQDLSSNENAIDLLEENKNKIDWNELSYNKNAIDLLKANMDKINWDNLSLNENAIDLLKANMDKINWDNLCFNENAIDLLKVNVDKINWSALCTNTHLKAMELLKKNQDKICWDLLYDNPNIFTYDYTTIEQTKHNINKDFTEWVWKPDHRDKWQQWNL